MTTENKPSLVHVVSVRSELRTDSNVVATDRPRLSWKIQTLHPNWKQARAELKLDGASIETLHGQNSVLVDWPFPPIEPRSRHRVQIRVTGEDGHSSEWSEPAEIVAGFMADDEWQASMVGLQDPAHPAQPALIRTEFDVAGPVARATLYATAHGVYQAEINGSEVDDQILKPGWTSYQFHLVHETTDVTDLVRVGRNALGLTLAGGWFTEIYGFRLDRHRFYGEQPSVAAQLLIEYEDGSTQTVGTDGTWRASSDGPLVSSGIYVGESYDSRREIPGWSEPNFDDRDWPYVLVAAGAFATPEARIAPAVRAIEERAVESVITSSSGKLIFDFGQNLVGRLRIQIRGKRGQKITLRHAEVLENGELGLRPLRSAIATDEFTFSDDESVTWEPRFTFHGFRYAQIDGLDGELDPAAVTAIIIHSDMQRTGWFESSNPLVNRLHENVVWSLRGNFLYLPTDCPQRDERLGWTGDIQVFAPTASFLYDVDGFLSGWLIDLEREQKKLGGVVPFIVPSVINDRPQGAAAWGDAATVVPWVLYERYQDLGVLRAQFESMTSWCDQLLSVSGHRHLWEDRFQFGDWLDPTAPPDYPSEVQTDPDIVASAYLFRSLDLTSRAGQLLGETEDAEHYARAAARVKAAFHDEFITPSGRMMSDSQTAYALALMFGLVTDESLRQSMGQRLATLVKAAGYRIGTGFVGTPLIAGALTESGNLATASRLLTQTEDPSWLYPVTMGATTIWERWDSMLENGTINPGWMTSFNHYAFGAVADWLHRTVAGLNPVESGYRVIGVTPTILPGFTHAAASHETPYGLARVGWRQFGDKVQVTATIPPNTSAIVRLPDGSDEFSVGSGSHEWLVGFCAPVEEVASAVSVRTPLADIIDDPAAYETVWKTIAMFDETAARTFRSRTKWTSGRALWEVLNRLSDEARASVAGALDELTVERG